MRDMRGTPLASLVISLAGVALVAAFLLQPRGIPSYSSFNLYVWGLFSALCLLGATATLFPHLCSHVERRPIDLDPSRTSSFLGILIVHGHHPMCDGFQGHEFAVNGKTFCAGCAGLLLGAFIAVIIATHRFVFRFTYPTIAAFAGVGFVVLGLLYLPLLRTSIPVIRSVFNATFVAGFALVPVGADGLGLEFDLIVVGLCVFWMFTRIQLSSWDHRRVCRTCGYRCDGEGG